jgi:hypothetical protein
MITAYEINQQNKDVVRDFLETRVRIPERIIDDMTTIYTQYTIALNGISKLSSEWYEHLMDTVEKLYQSKVNSTLYDFIEDTIEEHYNELHTYYPTIPRMNHMIGKVMTEIIMSKVNL